ncbi:hypothetical protein, partial [Mesorhizobium sp. M7A.T.Ca.US.000.02.2.1]|uniref:hypothetical protein n=1 Tax=Mesorhizobium sp. M7A.T.Ca.US.000.02.2.1 TaxID=2496793 RepID=UPI001AEC8E18
GKHRLAASLAAQIFGDQPHSSPALKPCVAAVAASHKFAFQLSRTIPENSLYAVHPCQRSAREQN